MTGLIKSPKKNTLARDPGAGYNGPPLKRSSGVNAQKRRADDGDDEGGNGNESS